MKFRASFCDPFQPDIKEIGDIEEGSIMSTFNEIPWNDLIQKMKTTDQEVYFSPSFELEHKESKNGLSVSAIDETEWYIFFKRPRMIKKKKWFKTVEHLDENYMTDLTGQSITDVRDCLEALIRCDFVFLEEKIK